MSEWKEYRLGDISKTIQTGPFGSQLHQSDYVDDGIPCIMPKNIGQHLNINCEEIAKVKPEDLNRLSRYKVIYGDIVYSRRGDIEKCAYITKEQTGWLCGTGCLNVRINEDLADSKFIAYYLSLPNTKSWLKKSAVGTTMLNLNTSILADVPITMPSLDEQRAIASILSSLDSKIENNRKICANLEAQAQALFKHWFIDFAPFKDGKFVESELGMIPEGWRVGTFTEIFNLCPGGTPKTSESSYWENGNIPFFSPKDVTGIYCFKTEKQITKEGLNNCSSRLYDTNTVLITCRGTVGKVTMSAVPMAMNQSNYAILAKEGYSQYYAYLMTVAIVRKLKFKAVGSVFDAITSKDFNEKIIIPDFATLKSFDSLISTFFEEIKAKGFESSRLTTLRDTLLPKLMSGALKV